MRSIIKVVFATYFALIGFSSCRKAFQHSHPSQSSLLNATPELIEKGLRLEQISIITGEVFKDIQIQNQYKNLVIRIATYLKEEDEAIYFKQIVDGEIFGTGKDFCRKFKEKYRDILNTEKYYQADKFKSITEKLKKKIAVLSSSRVIDPLQANFPDDEIFMTSDGTQIYFPYSENFINSTKIPAITYDPGYDPDIITANIFKEGSSSPTLIIIDEAYAQANPVYVINLGPLDAAGRVATTSNGINLDDLPPIPNIPPVPTPVPPSPRPTTPPPPMISCYSLTYNTYSDSVDDRYVVSNYMPRISITDNYRSIIGGGNYITVYQMFAIPRNVSINTDNGSLIADDTSRLITETKKIKRGLTKTYDFEFNQTWNGDWRLMQHTNVIVIAYKAGWLKKGTGKIDFNVGAGLRYNDTLGRFIPSFNFGFNFSGSVTLKSQYVLDGTLEITRRNMLSHVVGNGAGNGDALSEKVPGETIPWEIKRCGRVKFYFKTTICY